LPQITEPLKVFYYW